MAQWDDDAALVELARQAGWPLKATDAETAADVRRVVRQVAGLTAPFLRWLATLSAEDVARVSGLMLGEPDASCNCLCPVHRESGMFCAGVQAYTVTLVGGLIPHSQVPMCNPCAEWWRRERPHRVQEAVSVE